MLNTTIIEDVMSGMGKVDVATLRSLMDYLYRDVGGADRCALGHQGTIGRPSSPWTSSEPVIGTVSGS